MAKSKNHTAHNQTRKAHRNGIKRPKKKAPTLKHLNTKIRQNTEYSRIGSQKVADDDKLKTREAIIAQRG